MASAPGNRGSAGRSGSRNGTPAKGKVSSESGKRKAPEKEPVKPARKNVGTAIKNEVTLIVIFAVMIFIFLCVTGLIRGTVPAGISSVMFGLFGLMAYLLPLIVFFGFAFGISNRGNTVAVIKMVSSVVLVFLAGILSYMFAKQERQLSGGSLVKELYQMSSGSHSGGGVLFGSMAHGMYNLMGFGGTLFVVIVLAIICIVFITEKSFLSGVKRGGKYLIETAREDAARRREYRESLYDEYDDGHEHEGARQKWPRRVNLEKAAEPDSVKRMDRRARGVASSSAVTLKSGKQQDIHEITLLDDGTGEADMGTVEDIRIKPFTEVRYQEQPKDAIQDKGILYDGTSCDGTSYDETSYDGTSYDGTSYDETAYGGNEYGEYADEAPYDNIQEDKGEYDEQPETDDYFGDNTGVSAKRSFLDDFDGGMHDLAAIDTRPEPAAEKIQESHEVHEIRQGNTATEEAVKKYMLPPIELLKKGDSKKGDSSIQLRETALLLQQTLQNFGVKVTITDISQGPSVTRYEMQPEQGVKVSKIVGLADDIKLNLAATDIRIEAPIPGKAAVGIEVPNKENSAVALRDLLESDEFQKFPSDIAFAVGKDIAGKVVVTDIARMPHALIAGATGSGKSVCINTIIMSILYKADPDDVKLIMIDPKVVELSVYNGIPHLMIPVVTDPKKASAALNWGVAEMNDRYRKFADLNVRDLKGYNQAAESGKLSPDGEPLHKLPRIVIIVDELADLMMVASGEVEESICRLAQLARACGIHLIIATQRPSVDVITGLIKANMPSRIAFSVSSGTDSRTILDMNGAEKLLGKGDMLFYPQGLSKPARVQGAFVSDPEVSDVVDFLKNQMLGNIAYSSDIEEKIKTMQSIPGAQGSSSAGGANDVDAYFAEAGRFVIEKDKASIGMLQRVYKIGFNRAARIIDQLEEAGVVAAEEGTKPRRILMSMEQFQNYIEENL